jgi:hypothetical protein
LYRFLSFCIITSLSLIRRGFAPGFVNYTKRCTRPAVASDKVTNCFDHGRWVSPGTPASSTTKTGRYDIVEILLKLALNTKNQIESIICSIFYLTSIYYKLPGVGLVPYVFWEVCSVVTSVVSVPTVVETVWNHWKIRIAIKIVQNKNKNVNF